MAVVSELLVEIPEGRFFSNSQKTCVKYFAMHAVIHNKPVTEERQKVLVSPLRYLASKHLIDATNRAKKELKIRE